MSGQKNFVSGLFWNDPHPKAPEFIKGKISIKVEDFIAYLRTNMTESEYVNVILKESKNGKMYFELDTWKPYQQTNENRSEQNLSQDVDQRANEVLENQNDIRVENIPF